MTDDFLSRAYADHHSRLSGDVAAALRRFADTLRVSLDRLNAYEFDAPWRRQPPARRSAR